MYDIHCHILPGIDDGPDQMEDSLTMARLAAEDGTRTLEATPHSDKVTGTGGKDALAQRIQAFREEVASKGIVLSRDDNGRRSGWNPGHCAGEYGVNLEGDATGYGGRGHRDNLVTGYHSWEGPNGRRWRGGPRLSKSVRGANGIGPESRHQKDGPPDYWYRDTPNFHSVP